QSKRLQKLVKTKPMNATQRLLSYVQFIGDNDGVLPELQIVGSHLNWMVYFNIDVILVVFVVTLVIPLIILGATIHFLRKYLNKPNANREKKGPIGDKYESGSRRPGIEHPALRRLAHAAMISASMDLADEIEFENRQRLRHRLDNE
uniref:Uncharacterized protein n=1 Tax=Panagrolaimus sp. ES5 TaxID=591445 RepID=A0AC34G9V2_9BILA